MATSDGSESSELGRLGAVFVRRRWIWLPFLIVTPLMVFASVRGDPPVYAASAQVYLNRQNQLFSGIGDPTAWEPLHLMTTQLAVANRPEIGDLVADSLKLDDRGGGEIGGQTAVSSFGATDILLFTTKDEDPELARTIATEYARQYVVYRRQFDTAALIRAATALRKEIRRLERNGDRDSATYSRLRETEQRLDSAIQLQRGNAVFLRAAHSATQVEPRPWSAARDAFVLALIAGLGLAYVIDALDRRLRSSTDVASAFGLPLLARLPALPRSVLRRRESGTLLTRRAPEAEAEALRQLRTNLRLISARRPMGVVMVTSVETSRARAVVAPRLALSMARAGERVALLDLNVNEPTVHRLLGVPQSPGIADLLLGEAELRYVLRTVSATAWTSEDMSPDPSDAGVDDGGRLDVIPAGVVDSTAVDLPIDEVLTQSLDALREHTDLVLVDAPPLLTSSIGLALARFTDGVVLVARAGALTPGSAHEALRLLDRAATPPLGVVVMEPKAQRSSRLQLWARSPVARPA